MHGFGLHSEVWATNVVAFVFSGYRPSRLETYDYDFNAPISESAAGLGPAVDKLLANTNAEKVDIVSYSLGSFVAKACIIEGGCAGKVEHWMSLSGVDNGTSVELAPGVPSNEDVHGRTPLRQRLQDNWDEIARQGVKVEVQWTPHDEIVVPAELSQEPPPAVNKQVNALSHLTMPVNGEGDRGDHPIPRPLMHLG